MTRSAVIATMAACATVLLALWLCGVDLPKPPAMQSYTLAMGWKTKWLVFKLAFEYVRSLGIEVCGMWC